MFLINFFLSVFCVCFVLLRSLDIANARWSSNKVYYTYIISRLYSLTHLVATSKLFDSVKILRIFVKKYMSVI